MNRFPPYEKNRNISKQKKPNIQIMKCVKTAPDQSKSIGILFFSNFFFFQIKGLPKSVIKSSVSMRRTDYVNRIEPLDDAHSSQNLFTFVQSNVWYVDILLQIQLFYLSQKFKKALAYHQKVWYQCGTSGKSHLTLQIDLGIHPSTGGMLFLGTTLYTNTGDIIRKIT